jgi:SAM-dependent methyltransferase
VSVVWHDLECGTYVADLPLWRELAARHGDPVLDVGAGTGRVALDLARHGYTVTALDADSTLLEALSARAAGLPVSTVVADARAFELGRRFALCVVPMQTVQLLGGASGRAAFLRCVRNHLHPGGMIAAAVVEAVDVYEELDGVPGPLPDMLEREGVVYASRPTAVRADAAGFVLERRRERIDPGGERTVQDDVVRLDALSAAQLEAEGRAVGLRVAGRVEVAPTADHVGSVVVMLGA